MTSHGLFFRKCLPEMSSASGLMGIPWTAVGLDCSFLPQETGTDADDEANAL